MSTAGERENYEALRSSYIHLLSFFDTSAVHLGKKESLSGNVIKLSKSAHTKKKPISTFRGGHFLCFRYVDCLCLLRGQDNDLSLVNGVGVHKTVGVALEDGLVLHQTGIVLLSLATRFLQRELPLSQCCSNKS